MTFDKLKDLLGQKFDYDSSAITESTRIKEDLGADSIDIIEILMSLEEQYGIVIPDDKAAEIKTVGDVVPFLKKDSE